MSRKVGNQTITHILVLIVMTMFITLFGIPTIKAYYGCSPSTTVGISTAPLSFNASISGTSFTANSSQVVTIPVNVTNNSNFAVNYTITLGNSNLRFSGNAASYSGSIAANTTSTINLQVIEVTPNGTDTTSITMKLNTPYSKTINLGSSFNLIFDIVAPTLSVSVPSGTTYAKSKTATITLGDAVSGLKAGTYTIKYAWGTSAVACADMTSTTTITAVAGDKSKTATVTIDGKTGAGKIYVCNVAAVQDVVGNSLAASTTKNANMYLDNTTPSISIIDVNGNSLGSYYQTRTIKIRITDNHSKLINETYSIKYAIGSSSANYTCDSSQMTNTTTITPVAGSATADSAEITFSGVQSSYIYICNVTAIKDALSNTLAGNSTAKRSMHVDGVGPSLSVTVTDGTTYSKSKEATIKLSTSYSKLAAGSYNIYYAWGTSAVACSSMTNYITFALSEATASVEDTVTISTGTGAGKLYVCNKVAITDEVGNALAAETTKNANMYLDNTFNTVTISGGTTLKSTSQTLTLKCSDTNSTVTAYYWGTTAPTSASSITTTTNLSSLTSSSGWSPSAISSASTYYLACKDSLGNYKTTSIEFNSYTVMNMLQNLTGSTYTTTDYTKVNEYTYIAKKNTSLTLASIYTIPSGSSTARFKGASVGAPSTTAASPSTSAISLSGNITVAMWFQRNVIYIKYKTNGGLIQAETHSAGSTSMVAWTTDSDGYITRAGVNNFHSYRYGTTSIDLYNYNNKNAMFIWKIGYSAVSGSEWICDSGCTTSGTTFSHAAITLNSSNDMCNAASADCTIAVKVNWNVLSYGISYELGGGSAASSNPTSYNVDTAAITLNNPTLTGKTFTGWTEKIRSFSWAAGFITLNEGYAETSADYPDSYYSAVIRLKSGVTYTLSGFGDYDTSKIRWRVYNTSGVYTGNGSTSTTYTPSANCYVRIVFYGTSTSSQRSGTVITSNAGTSATIPKGSTQARTYTANWSANSYTITYDYHENYTYSTDEYLDTGYKINWGRNLTINETFKVTTSGKRYLIIGNYNSNSYTLNIEINTSNQLRLYMASGGVDKTSGSTTIPLNTNVSIVYTWNASTKAYSLTATASGMSNISITGTYTMSGTATNTLLTNRDHRGTGTFTALTVSALKIADTRTYNTALSDLPTAAETGWTFNGWYTASSGGTQISTSTTVPAANTTYHAHWTERTATLTYNANSCGTAPSNVTMKYTTATSAASSMTMTSGWELTGWNTKANGSGTSYAKGGQVKAARVIPSAITLYAQCRKGTTRTITYNGNGSTSGSTTASTCTGYAYNGSSTYGSCSITLASNGFAKTGYNFSKWAAGSTSGTQYAAGASVTISADATYYAIWSEKTATLTYNANSCGTAPSNVTMKYTTATSAASSMTMTSGWELTGWNTKSDGSGTSYAKGGQVKAANVVPSAITLYAQCRKGTTRTMTYNGNGNTGGSTTASTCTGYAYNGGSTYGSCNVSLRANGFTKTGYTFTKWAANSTSGTQYDPGTTITLTADVIYYATWKQDTWTKKTFNCTTGQYGQTGTSEYVCAPCNSWGQTYADNNNLWAWIQCQELSSTASMCVKCANQGLRCYNKTTHSRWGCSAYSSTAAETLTGQTSCTEETTSYHKITCTLE